MMIDGWGIGGTIRFSGWGSKEIKFIIINLFTFVITLVNNHQLNNRCEGMCFVYVCVCVYCVYVLRVRTRAYVCLCVCVL